MNAYICTLNEAIQNRIQAFMTDFFKAEELPFDGACLDGRLSDLLDIPGFSDFIKEVIS